VVEVEESERYREQSYVVFLQQKRVRIGKCRQPGLEFAVFGTSGAFESLSSIVKDVLIHPVEQILVSCSADGTIKI
jgi:hypothetical protein